PVFQSQKLLWIGWRFVSFIEQQGLGKVLLNAHLSRLDRLPPLFHAGVLHGSCYTGWVAI
ncbi:hypothetical protein CK222_31235, partial [Mesorhizobium sp. WSM3866]|uniref:hypothetical protein n=1 Tax=Mesorhizobium TaxID=68287 RepID=UPI000BDACD0B